MLLLVAALQVPSALADDHFDVAPGLTVSYADLLAEGQVLGRTGRVLVGLMPGASVNLGAVPAVASTAVLPGEVVRVTLHAGADDLAAARTLASLPGVEFAVPDLILPLRLHSSPDDPLLGAEWHIENTGTDGRTADVDIDATQAWDYATGAGQLIAIIDSGVQPDHPDLSVIIGYDYVGRDDDASPDYADGSAGPHGTGCAGIAAGVGNNGYGVAGVAYDADVYAIRLIGGSTSTDDVYHAFVEAVDAGATVLSNSWGYGSCEEIAALTVFTRMFRYAETEGRGGLGSAVVFAAGNDNCDTANNGMLNMSSPIVVAALEPNDVRSGYSNFGDAVDISAPTGLLTTDWTSGGYGSYDGDDAISNGFSGTSGATPVVAGVVALMFEANPRLTAAQARDVLCQTAVRVDLENVTYDSEGRNPYYGCGRIDAGAAVAAVANSAPTAPVATSEAEQVEGRVWLTWAPGTDSDDDALTYVVRASVDGEAVEWTSEQPFLRLDQAAGSQLLWSVSAVDPWGEGPASAEVSLTVIEAEAADPAPSPTPPSTCGLPAVPSAAGVLLAVLYGGSRRAKRAECC